MGGEALAEGLEEPDTTLFPVEGEVADLILQADAHYQAAQGCLETGDWTCYGAEMDALEQALQALVAAMEE